jgi:hypothetical protein
VAYRIVQEVDQNTRHLRWGNERQHLLAPTIARNLHALGSSQWGDRRDRIGYQVAQLYDLANAGQCAGMDSTQVQ